MKRTVFAFFAGVVATVAFLVMLSGLSNTRALHASSAQALGGSNEYEGSLADAAPPPPPARPSPLMKKGLGSFGTGPGGGGYGERAARGAAAPVAEAAPMEESAAEPEREQAEADGTEGPGAPRTWFPETFLFEPLVVTNEAGEARVPVRIPDRLTRWRVLGLAHTRTGEQSGAVASFQGTLPVYVEPVLPGFLVAGDEIRLPIQVVNTTGDDLTGALSFEVSGARAVESGGGTVRVPAQGSLLRYAVVRADKPGTAVIRARFGKADALTRELPVVPAGRPVVQTAGGTLAAPRTVTLAPPEEAIASATRVRLTVFPGALALLRSELGAAAGRGGAAEDAYGLLLAGRAPALLSNLGETADPNALRELTLVLQQRALQHARSNDTATAALLAEAALAHPDSPILSRLGERLVTTLATQQRPDGTFQGGDGWTLQRMLIATAEGTRALQAGAGTEAGARRAEAARIRASGAFERYLPQIQDAYTAAAVLASGATSGSVTEVLRTKVQSAIATSADGSRYLPVENGVVRTNGVAPSEVEATALAILALQGVEDAPLADLGSYLLARYSPARGWGDGRTNLAALSAVIEVFQAPLPGQVRVVLEQGGRVITEGTLDPKAREVLSFEAGAPSLRGGEFTVRAEPAIPGLGYRLQLDSWVPWTKEVSNGLELSVTASSPLKVGEPAMLNLKASGPAHRPLVLRAGLPAGVQVDRSDLEALARRGEITGFSLEDGAVTLMLMPRPGGQPFSALLPVFPTLGGKLHAAASSLTLSGSRDAAWSPSPAWVIR